MTKSEVVENKSDKKKKKDSDKAKFKRYVRELELAKLECEVNEAQNAIEVANLAHERHIADESHQGVFRLYSEIDGSHVEAIRRSTQRYASAYPGRPISLIISSPGGGVFDGWVLFDHLRSLSDQGHEITTIVRGYAGSMAAVLSQAGDVRVIGPESYLVIHEASTMSWGTASEVADESKLIKRLSDQALSVFTRKGKLTLKQLIEKTHKSDLYLDSKECKKYGLVDRVG